MEYSNVGNDKSANFANTLGNLIYIGDKFDETIMTNVIPEIDNIINNSMILAPENRKIIFNINSYGGELQILSAILTKIDMARQQGFTIETHNLGMAGSCASILAAYGDKGHRYMGRYAINMIHHFSRYYEVISNDAMAKRVAEFDRIEKLYRNMYLAHSKLTNKDLDKIFAGEGQYFSAEECKKMGLVDIIY